MVWSATVELATGNYTVTSILSKGDTNTKLYKSNHSGKGYTTVGVTLAPANLSGYEMCRGRSKGCTAACLNTAGLGQVNKVQTARIAKTKLLHEQREKFMCRLVQELGLAERKAIKEGKLLACRLNVLSDFPWEEETPSLFTTFPNVQFYDYTKILKRAVCFSIGGKRWPSNYHLTFSRSETNSKHIDILLPSKVNISVVFKEKPFPDTLMERPVIDGEETDLRFLDPPGSIIGLTAKGKGKKDTSGFVYPLAMVN